MRARAAQQAALCRYLAALAVLAAAAVCRCAVVLAAGQWYWRVARAAAAAAARVALYGSDQLTEAQLVPVVMSPSQVEAQHQELLAR